MKNINWLVRIKNPYFWIGIVAVILSAVGVTPETFTSWNVLLIQVKELLSNPYAIGCVIIALIGYVNDPTTAGLKDSKLAQTYTEPKKGD